MVDPFDLPLLITSLDYILMAGECNCFSNMFHDGDNRKP